jgi:SAM-dependent methyltransferase
MEELVLGLGSLWRSSAPQSWQEYVQTVCLAHPIRDRLHEDPLTWRFFIRPRGHANDATTLDMIYFPREIDLSSVSPLGRELFRYTSSSLFCRAVRRRRWLLGQAIDQAASERETVRVASAGCGHLREVELSRAVLQGRVGEFIAIDRDREALDVVDQCYARLGITTLHGEVGNLIDGEVRPIDCDLVYCANLFDQLDQKTARSLCGALFRMLRPGGRLLVVNLLSGFRDCGYLQSFMGCDFHLRTEADMVDLLAEVPRSEVVVTEVRADNDESLVCLTARRGAAA